MIFFKIKEEIAPQRGGVIALGNCMTTYPTHNLTFCVHFRLREGQVDRRSLGHRLGKYKSIDMKKKNKTFAESFNVVPWDCFLIIHVTWTVHKTCLRYEHVWTRTVTYVIAVLGVLRSTNRNLKVAWRRYLFQFFLYTLAFRISVWALVTMLFTFIELWAIKTFSQIMIMTDKWTH